MLAPGGLHGGKLLLVKDAGIDQKECGKDGRVLWWLGARADSFSVEL